MASGSILLPRKLGERLKEKAAETGWLPDELGVEFVRQGLNEELDPKDLVEQYQQTLRKFDQNASQELSEKYLRDGEKLLKEGDLVQASEKLWGASALAVKSVAAKRGLQLEQHGGLWVFVNLLAKESGDEDIVGFFGEANALHRNFYEDEMEKESVEILAPRIEQLITKLKAVKE
jgi:uncharacterized protein (UPF0332 family)